MKYAIYYIEQKEVCIPSTDYYRKSNDWYTETIECLTLLDDDFDSPESAIEYIKKNFSIYQNPERYIIQPYFDHK